MGRVHRRCERRRCERGCQGGSRRFLRHCPTDRCRPSNPEPSPAPPKQMRGESAWVPEGGRTVLTAQRKVCGSAHCSTLPAPTPATFSHASSDTNRAASRGVSISRPAMIAERRRGARARGGGGGGGEVMKGVSISRPAMIAAPRNGNLTANVKIKLVQKPD